MNYNFREISTQICIVLSFLLFGYVFLRVINLSFVHDESLTYLWNVNSAIPLSKVITYDSAFPSNNHLLNSLLMRFSVSVFGTNEFTLRLPNLIFYIFYLISSFLLVKKFRSPLVFLAAFLLLNLNPFLLDFFGLARGYGLGISFLMISILYFTNYFEKENPSFKDRFLPFLFAAFSVLSNFSFLNFYMAFFAAFILIQFWQTFSKAYLIKSHKNNKHSSFLAGQKPMKIFKDFFPSLAVTTLLLAAVLPLVLKLKALGELYIGGKTGFFSDTVITVVRNYLYSDVAILPLEKIISYLVVSLFFGSLFILFFKIYRLKFLLVKKEFSSVFFVVFVTFLTALSSIVQHYLFGINFLTDRMGIFFIPLFILSLAFLFDELFYFVKNRKINYILSGVLIVFLTFSFINFIYNLNFSYSLTWKYDAETKDFINDLVEVYKQKNQNKQNISLNLNNRKINLGIDWVFEPSINFYIVVKKLNWLNFVDRRGIVNGNFDYYFYPPSGKSLLIGRKIQELKIYPLTGNIFSVAID